MGHLLISPGTYSEEHIVESCIRLRKFKKYPYFVNIYVLGGVLKYVI